MTSIYKYFPLQEPTQEIRLLTLKPGQFSDPVHVLLEHVPLRKQNAPKYEALSYVWGSTHQSIDISVGDEGEKVLPVTQNLATALPYLRHGDTPRILWVDAICVNQQDLKERGQQVERMGDIYTLATRVVAWLGPAADNSSLALELLGLTGSKVNVDWSARTMHPTDDKLEEAHWADASVPLAFNKIGMRAIHTLIHRPWFERLWIRQEIRLANENAVVICGFDTRSWELFRRAIFCMLHKVRDMPTSPTNDRVGFVYSLIDYGRYIPLKDLISTCRDCKCSDSRDRVYAMLNLLPRFEKNMNIKPDYSKTVAQVYEHTVRRYLELFQKLSILVACEMREEQANMPTWVPDWSLGRITSELNAGFADVFSSYKSHFLDSGILRTKGVRSVTVNTVGKFKFDSGSAIDVAREIRRLAPPSVFHDHYVGGGSLLHAYCCALSADEFSNGFHPAGTKPFMLSTQRGMESLRSILSAPDLDSLRALLTLPESFQENAPAIFCSHVRYFCTERTLLSTETGYIGLGPPAARPNDQVCVLLGCMNLMLLRPTENGKHQIVGECYVKGLSSGEVLLGPFPHTFRFIRRFDMEAKSYFPAFINNETGVVQKHDPRLEAPSGEEERYSIPPRAHHAAFNALLKKSIEKRGVEIVDFSLV
jgi:hypothetical protein